MPEDAFQSFDQLRQQLKYGEDYEFKIMNRASPVAVIAPHGGRIETGTSEIAAAIAGDSFSLYCFEGIKRRPHHEIHITSHRFDEPCCIEMISQCDFVVAVHGRKDDEDDKAIFLGGRDTGLRDAISDRLKDAGFSVKRCGHKFPASHPANICNRGRRKMGAQLELPLSLRKKLMADKELLGGFAGIVRGAIATRSAQPPAG